MGEHPDCVCGKFSAKLRSAIHSSHEDRFPIVLSTVDIPSEEQLQVLSSNGIIVKSRPAKHFFGEATREQLHVLCRQSFVKMIESPAPRYRLC